LDEDRGNDAASSSSRNEEGRMDVHIGGCNVQHGPDAKSDGRRTHLTREGDEDFDPASPKAGNIETLIKTDFLLIHSRGMNLLGIRGFSAA
jgi:hypothetical protein